MFLQFLGLAIFTARRTAFASACVGDAAKRFSHQDRVTLKFGISYLHFWAIYYYYLYHYTET